MIMAVSPQLLLIFILLPTIWSEGTADCEAGWLEHRGNCFTLYQSDVSIHWITAERRCHQYHATLASIRDQQETDFIYQLLNANNSTQTGVYIGLRFDAVNNEHRWTDGRPMTYTNWFNGDGQGRQNKQPDGGIAEACTMMASESHWHDVPCAAPETKQFLCVKQTNQREFQAIESNGFRDEQGTLECPHNLHTCASGECIHTIFICDGSRDCMDGSDEANCENAFGVIWHKSDISSGCGIDQVRCSDSYQCISVSYLCDFIPHCLDGSDEMQCDYPTCDPLTEFQCSNGQCIDISQQCDLIEHCIDKSDETFCDHSSHGFQCFDGTWLPLSAKCDGQKDCFGSNWEDEPLTCNENRTASDNDVDCNNGALTENTQACHYDIDNYGFPVGCRDMSHLIGCGGTECNDSYMKCPDSYCIHVRHRCDGKWHCPNGEDELECDEYTCPGLYRCHGYRHCLTDVEICDGITQCPLGDDELFCNVQCASGCKCVGQSYLCDGISWDSSKAMQIPSDLRQLTLTGIGAMHSTSDNMTIENTLFIDFNRLKMLFILDISKNRISYLKRGQFRGNSNLQKLILSDNDIIHLAEGTFTGLQALIYLDLSRNPLMKVDTDVFFGLQQLVFLDMRTTDDIEVRPSRDHFGHLSKLKTLWSSEFMICCLVSDSDTISECLPGDSNEFSNCEDLICNKFLRLFMWVLGVSALIGNTFVIVWRTSGNAQTKGRKSSVQAILVSNLAVADLLMGIYMLIIASADKYYRPKFMEGYHGWKTGIICNIAGFLAVLSSEASIFFLTLISVDRFICISFPFSSRKLTTNTTKIVALVVWAITFLISAIPPIAPDYFGEKYYGRSSVCLALPLITRHRTRGYHYSLAIFLGLNLVLFLIMLICYIGMYLMINASTKSIRAVGNSQQRDQVQLAIRMGFLIGTNFLCWMPIIVCGLLSVAGVWELHPVIYAWVAVFVLPFNASLNPYLYTILTREMAKKKAKKDGSSENSTNMSRISRVTGASEYNKSVRIVEEEPTVVKEPKERRLSTGSILRINMSKNHSNGIDMIEEENDDELTSGSSLFKKAMKDQTESHVFMARTIDQYKDHLIVKYLKKSKTWPGFTEKDIVTIRQDIGDAIKTLHRQGVKHGSVDEQHILVDEVDGSKRYFLLLSSLSEWQKIESVEDGDGPKLSDLEQLQILINSLPFA